MRTTTWPSTKQRPPLSALEAMITAKKLADKSVKINRTVLYGHVMADHYDEILAAMNHAATCNSIPKGSDHA